ncbi:MAG: precorrin-2 C(20)-methyltransferase [Christensenellales bacterium]|jgi:precorrin-2 C(20)-methyltransferase
MGSLIFVGVGPGDPELITFKAVKALQGADTIALPDSGAGTSAAETIVAEWIQGKSILRLPMPMRGEKEDWAAAHAAAADALIDLLRQGRAIAYPVLGDPLLYATSGYLLQSIAPHHPCEVIPGIPAMCAAAARVQQPLAEGREPLTILPGYEPDTALPDGNVVVMKAGRSLAALQRKLTEEGRIAWVVQNLGMPGEQASPIQSFNAQGRQGYFTTVLVKP